MQARQHFLTCKISLTISSREPFYVSKGRCCASKPKFVPPPPQSFFRDVREDILLWQPSKIQLLHEVLPKGLPKCRVLGDQHLILQS